MRFQIKHERDGRIRIHLMDIKKMSCRQADTLQYYLENTAGADKAKVYESTSDVAICFATDPDKKNRERILHSMQKFHFEECRVPDDYLAHSGREMNSTYRENLVMMVLRHYAGRLLLPVPVRLCINALRATRYIREGLACLREGRLEVPVLDATAITVSMLRGNTNTAGSVMFLLRIGELLEEWTHKKSVSDLARIMSLNVDKVWIRTEETEVQVPYSKVKPGDRVIVHMGNVIPFDGTVCEGEGLVNQASLTGESLPVRKTVESTVYAGTVVEEGRLIIKVKKTGGSSTFENIVRMIEESEKMKSGLESEAEHLADRLVPYTLAGTGLVWLFTRNITKTLAVLMVDFSCALKLAMPISVLSAIREAGHHQITVKGGRFLEAVAQADTIVFDKTGTLTRATPTVCDVISFNGHESDELLRIAACLEEHFPHSIANAVVEAASKKGLLHEEMHSRVEYIVAHGIATTIDKKRAVIGSYHFVFEDENATIPEGKEELFRTLPTDCSHLYLAIEGRLAAVICINDPLREEAPEVVRVLKEAGFSKVVMMTGDSDRTARTIAGIVGAHEYFAEVLPEDKANYVEREKQAGRTVIMIGDGINDSPALSAADVGIAIGDGAEIAREVADITISAGSLYEILTLKQLSDGLVDRIRRNYRSIVGFNGGLIILGVAGIIQPTTSALLHNLSTILISLRSMRNILTWRP